MKEILGFIVALCTVIGCSETAVQPKVEVPAINNRMPDSAVTQVVITMRNESHSTVYYTHKDDLIGFWRLERKVDSGWVDADRVAIKYTSFYPGGRKRLPPGDTLCDSIIITQHGTYRLGFPFAWDEDEMDADSLSAREFVVEKTDPGVTS